MCVFVVAGPTVAAAASVAPSAPAVTSPAPSRGFFGGLLRSKSKKKLDAVSAEVVPKPEDVLPEASGSAGMGSLLPDLYSFLPVITCFLVLVI